MARWFKAWAIPHDHPLRVEWRLWGEGAWYNLVGRANWRDGKTLKRGQLYGTARTLAEDWDCGRHKAHCFLVWLEAQGMIEYARKRGTRRGRKPSVITICNYERYQASSNGDGDKTGTSSGQVGDTSVEGKKGRTSVQGSSTPPPSVKPQRSADADTPWPEDMQEEKDALREAGLLETELNDPAWWRAQYAWVKSEGVEVYLLTEFKKWWAHQLSQSGRKRHKALRRSFRNWLATSARWSERESQRRAIRGERPR